MQNYNKLQKEKRKTCFIVFQTAKNIQFLKF